MPYQKLMAHYPNITVHGKYDNPKGFPLDLQYRHPTMLHLFSESHSGGGCQRTVIGRKLYRNMNVRGKCESNGSLLDLQYRILHAVSESHSGGGCQRTVCEKSNSLNGSVLHLQYCHPTILHPVSESHSGSGFQSKDISRGSDGRKVAFLFET